MKKSNIVDFQFPDMPIWNTHGTVRDAALDSSLRCYQAPIYSQAHVLRSHARQAQSYACRRNFKTAQRSRKAHLTEQSMGHVTLINLISTLSELITLITLITVTTVRISLVYRKTRSLLCSCVQLIVHSDCLVYNDTKPLLQYFITATCPLHRVQTRPLSHLTSHSRDGSHLGSQDPNICLIPEAKETRTARN